MRMKVKNRKSKTEEVKWRNYYNYYYYVILLLL